MTIAFVESSASGAGHAAIKSALDIGVPVVLLTSDPDRYDLPFDGITKKRADTSNLAEVIGIGRAIPNLKGLGTTYEYFTVIAAEAAQALGLPGPDPIAISNCRSKAKTRVVLSKFQPDLSPPFILIRSLDDLEEAFSLIDFPLVIKAPELTGGGCVAFAKTKAEARRVASSLLSLEVYSGRKLNGTLVVEGFLDGPEYSVETFGTQILAITKKVVAGGDGLIERGHDMPALLPDTLAESIGSATLNALSAVGLVWGPAHTEIKVTNSGPKIVEINARLGGGRITDLVRLSTGIDYAKAYVDSLMGLSPTLERRRSCFASVRFICPNGSGTIGSIEGLDAAAIVPDVHSVGSLVKPGHHHTQTGNNRDRLAWVVSTSSDQSACVTAAEKASSLISFRLREDTASRTQNAK